MTSIRRATKITNDLERWASQSRKSGDVAAAKRFETTAKQTRALVAQQRAARKTK